LTPEQLYLRTTGGVKIESPIFCAYPVQTTLCRLSIAAKWHSGEKKKEGKTARARASVGAPDGCFKGKSQRCRIGYQ
jgi:hypothetical protein